MAGADLIVDNLASLATVGADGAFTVTRGAAVAAAGGRILAAGDREQVRAEFGEAATEIDAAGMSAIPGLVDCHTHCVWAGSRVDEFDRRAQGQTYEQIGAAGGGIRATVEAVRAATDAELAALAGARLSRMRSLGTTTAEVKSGYGLDPRSEAAMLRAAHAGGAAAGVRVTGTCLALHAVPAGVDADAYVREAIEVILPACAGLATAADCFLERGAFSAAECRPYLEAARALGLDLRIHGDQFSECGAVPLAAELHATSVDHLEQTGEAGVRQLAESGVAAVCLPLCALYLDLPMPPARALLEAGARVVLATDYNPGSAPCDAMLAALNLACTRMRLSCAEALTAGTAAAAEVLGLGAEVGRLAPGYAADIVLIADPDWRAALYHLGEVPARVLAALAARATPAAA
jgi:imidazolonepropionase